MSSNKDFDKRVSRAKFQIWIASRASRTDSLVNRFLRWLLNRGMRLEPESDFMRDELIDSDVGFDPEELERYQRGE